MIEYTQLIVWNLYVDYNYLNTNEFVYKIQH